MVKFLTRSQDGSRRLQRRRRQKSHHKQCPSHRRSRLPDVLHEVQDHPPVLSLSHVLVTQPHNQQSAHFNTCTCTDSDSDSDTVSERQWYWHWLCVLAFKCHHPTCPTNFNKSLEWSPDSVWNHRVRQRSSYHLLEGRQWVTERFLSLPPGRGTVCRQQSLLRQPCIHSVEPCKLIYSPHLSHHLSYIICILS